MRPLTIGLRGFTWHKWASIVLFFALAAIMPLTIPSWTGVLLGIAYAAVAFMHLTPSRGQGRDVAFWTCYSIALSLWLFIAVAILCLAI